MNILIVDDEYYIVKGIVENTDWNSLGIEKQFAAYSALQARQILEGSENIDIVLTDIEMPRESGLDLVAWMNDNGFHPVVIVLTGHQRFDYAQKALNMHIFSYLLKPIDTALLTAELQKAVHEVPALAMSQHNRDELLEQQLLESSSDITDTVKKYIKDHLSDPELNRQMIADEIHMNVDYLSHIFHKKADVSLSTYINDMRINTAKKLLSTTTLSLQQISDRCGFSNTSYFSRQFKKITGTTPQQYRTNSR